MADAVVVDAVTPAPRADVDVMVDTAELQRSFAEVAQRGDEVPLYFYSQLFLRHPPLRALFPASLAGQRDRFVAALGHVLAAVDDAEVVVPYLRGLARDHQKYGVLDEHYPMVGDALLATLEHFLGPEWTPQLAHGWATAYHLISELMIEATRPDPTRGGLAPAEPWQEAEVLRHERRAPGVAVITVRPDVPLGFRAGQSFPVQTPAVPKAWRYYSPANARRADGTIEFHVRAVDAGWVSPALVLATSPGDVLRLGRPVGDGLSLRPGRAPVVMIAGGTGLAPLRALVEQLIADEDAGAPTRPVHLVLGARSAPDLYDLPTLQRLAARREWLYVDGVAAASPAEPPGRELARAAVDAGIPPGAQVLVCGSAATEAAVLRTLAEAGIDPATVGRERHTYRRHHAGAQSAEVQP